MALTPEEKQKVLDMLDKADEEEKKQALSSQQSFGDWLADVLYDIFIKIRDFLGSLWQSICNWFS